MDRTIQTDKEPHAQERYQGSHREDLLNAHRQETGCCDVSLEWMLDRCAKQRDHSA